MYSVLLLNGGVGSRVGGDKPKQLLKVRGIPLLVYSLVALDGIESINQIVLNYPSGWREVIEKLLVSYSIKTPVVFVEAGDTRHASVAAMLSYVTNDYVLIHESARPLVTQGDFEKLIEAQEENISYMLPISFTVAPVDPEAKLVTGSLERHLLRNVQLPQKFNTAVLKKAHEYASSTSLEFTEDATLVASAGYPVHFVDGNEKNFKVTTPLDVTIAGHLFHEEGNDV